MKEFKEFATKGNVVDLAVGVIIGGAFGTIVSSMVDDVIMPVIGTLFSADFSSLYIPLSSKVETGLPLAEAKKLGPVLAWGNFITKVINFVILAFVIFLMVKGINKLKRQEEPAPPAEPAPSSTDVLLGEIRDLLQHK